jgi:hypothetical protein
MTHDNIDLALLESPRGWRDPDFLRALGVAVMPGHTVPPADLRRVIETTIAERLTPADLAAVGQIAVDESLCQPTTVQAWLRYIRHRDLVQRPVSGKSLALQAEVIGGWYEPTLFSGHWQGIDGEDHKHSGVLVLRDPIAWLAWSYDNRRHDRGVGGTIARIHNGWIGAYHAICRSVRQGCDVITPCHLHKQDRRLTRLGYATRASRLDRARYGDGALDCPVDTIPLYSVEITTDPYKIEFVGEDA